jgi:1-deoxy-D-xylulose-5-phosphate synthase
MVLPDHYQDHDNPTKQYDDARLNAAQIVAEVLVAMGVEEKARAVIA